MRTSGSGALLWVGHYKCHGLPHQWCRIREQRQANPLSCCAPCIYVCSVSVCVCEASGRREGDGFRLQAALKSVYSLRWALRGQPYSSPSLPLHYSRSWHTLFSASSLGPQGPIEPLTNTLTYLTDPFSVTLSVCLSFISEILPQLFFLIYLFPPRYLYFYLDIFIRLMFVFRFHISWIAHCLLILPAIFLIINPSESVPF